MGQELLLTFASLTDPSKLFQTHIEFLSGGQKTSIITIAEDTGFVIDNGQFLVTLEYVSGGPTDHQFIVTDFTVEGVTLQDTGNLQLADNANQNQVGAYLLDLSQPLDTDQSDQAFASGGNPPPTTTDVASFGTTMVEGSKNADTIDQSGATQAQIILGGAGNDILTGSAFDDFLYGELGDDTLTGGAGIDLLSGGLGDDVLLGGGDGDVLMGGQGNDVLTGGAGSDTFVIFQSDTEIAMLQADFPQLAKDQPGLDGDAVRDSLVDFDADEDILDLRELLIGFEPDLGEMIEDFVQVSTTEVRVDVTGSGTFAGDSSDLVATFGASADVQVADSVTIIYGNLPTDTDIVTVV
jgi:Ca2+-binding RTX toxin-like protein